MISKFRLSARTWALALAALALTAFLPTGTAYAIDHVECKGGENYLKIWSHSNGRDSVDCYANKGRTDFGGWWVDKISTGNNDLIYYDANGDSVKIERGRTITFPNRPPKISSIEIL